MNKLVFALSIAFILTLFSEAFSQNTKPSDVIFRIDGNTIRCKVTEITDESVSYKMLDNLEGPNYKINKKEVSKIVYANGKTEEITPPLKNGITGIDVEVVSQEVIVKGVMEGGPSQRAGILANDKIRKIDNTSVMGKDLKAVEDMLNGSPGSNVDITIERVGMKQPFTFSVVRINKDSLHIAPPISTTSTEPKKRDKLFDPKATTTDSSSALISSKRMKRFLGGYGIFKNSDELLFAYSKVGYENIFQQRTSKVLNVPMTTGVGGASSGFFDFQRSSVVAGRLEIVFMTKYYLSAYSFVEYDLKYLSGGLSAGPALNLTRGRINATGLNPPAYNGEKAGFMSAGLHFAEYFQKYVLKDKKGREALLVRMGWDQFFMLKGGYVSSFSLTLGF
jgi:hypothetical protein